MNLNKRDIYNLWTKGEGACNTLIHSMEEMSELTQAISKILRSNIEVSEDLYFNLIEEMADVYICLAMIQSIFSISDRQMNSVCDAKMIRNIDRIGIHK